MTGTVNKRPSQGEYIIHMTPLAPRSLLPWFLSCGGGGLMVTHVLLQETLHTQLQTSSPQTCLLYSCLDSSRFTLIVALMCLFIVFFSRGRVLL